MTQHWCADTRGALSPRIKCFARAKMCARPVSLFMAAPAGAFAICACVRSVLCRCVCVPCGGIKSHRQHLSLTQPPHHHLFPQRPQAPELLNHARDSHKRVYYIYCRLWRERCLYWINPKEFPFASVTAGGLLRCHLFFVSARSNKRHHHQCCPIM